jgi:hypothetical protein
MDCCKKEVRIETMHQTVEHHGNAIKRLDTKIDTAFSHKESKCDKILEQINQDGLKSEIKLLNHTMHEFNIQMETVIPGMQRQLLDNDRRFADFRLSTEKRITKILTVGSVTVILATLAAIVVPHFFK